MADDTTTTVPTVTDDDFDDDDAKDGDKPKKASDGLKADLAAERDKRQAAEKLASETQARLKKLEDAGKEPSQIHAEELERLKGEHQTLNKDVGELRDENLKLKVALQKGMPWKLAQRLRGSDEKELLADADDLLSEFAPSEKKKPKFNGGPQGGDAPAAGNMNALIGEMARRR